VETRLDVGDFFAAIAERKRAHATITSQVGAATAV